MPIEVKNLRIKVNVNGDKTETAGASKPSKKWTDNEVMKAIDQAIKSKKER